MRLLTGILLLLIGISSFGQDIPVGDWRVHSPYSYEEHVVKAGSQTYFASVNGIFYFDEDDNSLNTLTKVDGLSDIRISAIAYHAGEGYLIIGYENGNIDLVNETAIININDIERKNIIGSKKINHLYTYGDFVYVSTDFGVVVLNVKNQEIKETYGNIGPSGVQLQVYASTINPADNYIYLVTEQGVMNGDRDGPNLLDYNNWNIFDATSDSIPTTGITTIATLNDTVFVAIEEDTLLYYNGTNWTRTDLSLLGKGEISSLTSYNNHMMLSVGGEVIEINGAADYTTLNTLTFNSPSEAIKDANGIVWIADYSKGMVSNRTGTYKATWPNGPLSRSSFRIYNHDNTIVVSGGGFDLGGYAPNYSSVGFYIFENGSWINKNPWSSNYPSVQDLGDAIYNSIDGKYYFASYTHGIMTWDREVDEYDVINDTTTGSNLVAFGSQLRITDLHQDDDGNVWIASHVQNLGEPSLHRLDPSGTMTEFSFNVNSAKVPLEIVIDDYGSKWMNLGGTGGLRGIYVFNENNISTTSDDQGKYLSTSNNLPDPEVNTIAKDKNGEIWCGTNQGIAVFYNPYQVFDASNIQASTPIFDFRPLLKEEIVTAIKVDGGNRKWIGTQNGVWLFNETGTKEVYHFNVDNSPLPSNTILDIEINEQTGEVFFATTEGLISWRGTATESNGIHEDVNIFPNPVTPDFDGFVGITGLATNAIVKITDVSGKLIYETDANGGMATWDVRGLNNQRAKTGVYLIYSATEDGQEAFVGKIAVVE